MKYAIIFNHVRAEYQVWATRGNTSEIVKRFKTAAAAERWVAAHA